MSKNVTNTTKRVSENPILGLMDALNIPATEKRAQNEIVNSSQLPRKWNGSRNLRSLKEQYELMGIKVIGDSKDDQLFMDVVLPEGWKIQHTDHAMWNQLVDNNGRVRARFFYKGAFYDRDAHINFQTRYSYDYSCYLTTEEKGHYEKKTVKIINPEYRSSKNKRQDEDYVVTFDQMGYQKRYMRDDYRKFMKYITTEKDVWIPKYKDYYEEENNTPHYYELKDGYTVFLTTKDNPQYFRRKFRKDRKEKWVDDFETFRALMRNSAVTSLNEKYPKWEDVNAYWD